jgi:hypothetical protein
MHRPSSCSIRQPSFYAKWRPETRSDLNKWMPAVAGVVGGGLSTLLLHPLDILKTRQSVFGGSVMHHLRRTASIGGLYRGVGANILVSGNSWGIYFAT